DRDLAHLIDEPPPDLSADVLGLLESLRDSAGRASVVQTFTSRIPTDLRRAIETNALNLDQLAVLHEALGIASAADLAIALERDTIRSLDGFDAAAAAALSSALSTLRAQRPRITLGRAAAIALPLISRLQNLPGVERVDAVGSLRRGEDSVGDIEIVAAASDPDVLFDQIVDHDAEEIRHRGPRRLYVSMSGVEVGLRCPETGIAGSALLHLTGTRTHLEALRRIADERGWDLGTAGLQR